MKFGLEGADIIVQLGDNYMATHGTVGVTVDVSV